MFTFYTTGLDLGLGLLAKRDEEREILWAQNVALTWKSERIDNKFNSKILRQTGKKWNIEPKSKQNMPEQTK